MAEKEPPTKRPQLVDKPMLKQVLPQRDCSYGGPTLVRRKRLRKDKWNKSERRKEQQKETSKSWPSLPHHLSPHQRD